MSDLPRLCIGKIVHDILFDNELVDSYDIMVIVMMLDTMLKKRMMKEIKAKTYETNDPGLT